MKKTLIIFVLFVATSLFAQIKTDFETAYNNAERNPRLRIEAENLAISKGLPLNIYLKDNAMIEAIAVEGDKVVYSVITDFVHPFSNGFCAYYEDIQRSFDLSKARITYGNRTIDNTGTQLIFNNKKLITKVYLIPCMTSARRNVWAFDYNTGDLVDSAFIPYSNPILQTPRTALQLNRTKVYVADQLSDVVQMFDTSGAFLQTFAPAGGLNNTILDNVRDIAFRDNGNLLVTNAGTVGNSQNTVQQFSTTGAFINTFASDSLSSPYNLLFRTNDLLVSNSSGIHNIARFNKNTGAYLGDFIASTLNFPQQLISLSNGQVGVAEFSGALSGIRIYDSLGVFIVNLNGVTGIRGIWKLPNGNFLTTNSVGVYEVNGTTGALVRTIVSGFNFTCISVFDPNIVTGSNETVNTIPEEYKLYANFPNPFNPSTTIKFSIPKNENVKLTVYDALGRVVSELANDYRKAGTYEINFNAENLTSGIYFYKLNAGDFSEVKKMMLIK